MGPKRSNLKRKGNSKRARIGSDDNTYMPETPMSRGSNAQTSAASNLTADDADTEMTPTEERRRSLRKRKQRQEIPLSEDEYSDDADDSENEEGGGSDAEMVDANNEEDNPSEVRENESGRDAPEDDGRMEELEIAEDAPDLTTTEDYEKNFKWILVRVKIDEVEQPPRVIRPTDKDKIGRYVNDFVDGKYGLGGKFIHITLMNLPEATTKKLVEVLEGQVENYKELSVWEYLEQKHNETFKLIEGQVLKYIDGGHRGMALKNPLVQEIENCKIPKAKFYFHREFKPMRKHNIQSLGSAENDMGSKTIKMTMHDMIQNAVSYLGNLYDDNEDPGFHLQVQKEAWREFNKAVKLTEKTKQFAILCKKGFINASETRGDMTKYCTIAIGVHNVVKGNDSHEDELMKIMRKCKDLSWLGATSLWDTKSFRAQKWLFNRVYALREAYLKPTRSRGRNKGRKSKRVAQPAREVIPKYLYKLWQILVKIAAEVDIGEGEILSTEIYPEGIKSSELMRRYLENWCKNQRVHDWVIRTKVEWGIVLKEFEKNVRRDCRDFKDRSPAEEIEYQEKQVILARKAVAEQKRIAAQVQLDREAARKKKEEDDREAQRKQAEEEEKARNLQLETEKNAREAEAKREKQEENLRQFMSLRLLQRYKKRNAMQGVRSILNDGEDEFDLPPIPATAPPGTRDYDFGDGSPTVADPYDAFLPYWLEWKRSLNYNEYIGAKDIVDFKDGVPRVLKDTDHNFEIIRMWEGGKGILWNLPDRRESGWSDMDWETDEIVPIGEYRWRSGTVPPAGGLHEGEQVENVRLFEDYERPWIKLEKPFVMSERPKMTDKEYDFIRYPPVEGRFDPSELDPQKVLMCLGMRMPHRALMKLNLSDIYNIRRHLASNILRKEAPESVAMVEHLLRKSGQLLNKSGESIRIAHNVLVEQLTNIFRNYRERIDSSGFVVFEGILDPEEKKPIVIGLEKFGEDDAENRPPGNHFKDFANFFEDIVPTERQLRQNSGDHKISQEALDVFSTVRDTRYVPEDAPYMHVNSRLTTTKQAVTNMFQDMQDDEEGENLLKAKLIQEVAKLQLSHWLRLEEESFDATSEPGKLNGYEDTIALRTKRRSVPELYCPDTGSRLLCNASKYGDDQVPHIDYCLPATTELKSGTTIMRYPPYFYEATTWQPTPIWIGEGSHDLTGRPAEEREEIAKYYQLRLHYIPSWSIFISRGDVIHAGGSGKLAANFPGSGRCPRLHLYQGRRDVPLPDSINDQHARFFTLDPRDKAITAQDPRLHSLIRRK